MCLDAAVSFLLKKGDLGICALNEIFFRSVKRSMIFVVTVV